MSNILGKTYASRGGFVIPGQEDLVQQALSYTFNSVLDIGAGNLCATRAFMEAGKSCSATVNNSHLYNPLDIKGVRVYNDVNIENLFLYYRRYDAIWCAHVLEHTLNPGKSLLQIRKRLKTNGILFLMVPPFKDSVVGGHVSVGWNIGILMYFLILCGFNVREGSFIRHGYNIAAFVRKGDFPGVDLNGDAGDIELLQAYFPEEVSACQGFNGAIDSVNWSWKTGIH